MTAARKTFIYNFKPHFAEAVASGIKCQTIRRHRKNGVIPRPDDIAYLYTGLRTRNAKLLRIAPIVRVRAVEIYIEEREIWLDGEPLSMQRAVEFARADGFSSLQAMLAFFDDIYGLAPFKGVCIEWATEA